MCGILGVYNFNRNKIVDKDYLWQRLNILSHRGPDDWGMHLDQNVGMGFRRLSIIDLSLAGHQPMSNDDGSLWLIFNGELYNYLELREDLQTKRHTFKSQSDSEVLLHAYEEYGENCVNLFNGMWAFVIWDRTERKLFASRDRFGIKPFYYFADKESFIWASEIKALLTFSGIPVAENAGKVYEYIAYGALDRSEETMFKGIYQIKPGHNLVVKERNVHTYRYWNLVDSVNNYDKGSSSKESLYKEFRELFFSAVKLHMRSDVGVWTLLSGGLDSSAVASVQKKMKIYGEISSTIKTISLVHKRKEINEYEYVEELVDGSHLTNQVVACDEDDFMGILEKVIYIQDEPFPQMTPFNHYLLMERLHQENIKVVLSGEGADECLCGYLPLLFSYYLADLLKSSRFLKLGAELWHYAQRYRVNKDFHTAGSFIAQLFKAFFPRQSTIDFKAKHLDKSLVLISENYRKEYGKSSLFNEYKRNYTTLNNHLLRMLMTDSLPLILHMEDRNSMAFSIEQRVPFLDYRLVEFIFSLSNAQKIEDCVTKKILRESLKGILPEKVRTRVSKLSFNAPEAEWVRSDKLYNYLKDIDYRSFLSTGIVDRDGFERAFVNFRDKGHPYRLVFWRVINYIIWKKVYRLP